MSSSLTNLLLGFIAPMVMPRLPTNLNGLIFDGVIATSRFTYTQPGGASITADNNSGFVGIWNSARDYRYTSSTFAIAKTGVTSKLDYPNSITYVTSYPAGFQIQATDGALVRISDSLIYKGKLEKCQSETQLLHQG
jgi:hypothetical protein